MVTPDYLSWKEITGSIEYGDSGLRMNLSGNLTEGQQQMLVPYFRKELEMSHAQACSAAIVSDKGGKNAFRVDENADPMVSDVVRSGLTTVNDALIMVTEEVPKPMQRLAAVKLQTGKVNKLRSCDFIIEHITMRRQPGLDYTVVNIINDGCFLDSDRLETMLRRLQTKQNVILQGPPGTGKTWLSKRLAYALIGRKDDEKIRQVQFHPNLSYEDFVRGWRPDGKNGLVLADGPFLKLAEDARNDPDGKYVMVIEEINRGNPASIFGELLTLLEADKRTPNDALALAYPRNDGERFHIPDNVYIIGTMNLADRSLALVDFALRRRFAFFDLEPQLNYAWRKWVHRESGIPTEFLDNVAARISALNAQIAEDRNLGKQFRIDHSRVTPPPATAIDHPVEWFTEIVETEIAPLLREYWFDDPNQAEEQSQKLLSGL